MLQQCLVGQPLQQILRLGKSVVVGVRDQTSGEITAKVVPNTSKAELQGFVRDRVYDTTEIYTDEASGYTGLPNRQMVRHSIGEYVNNQAHVNGMESFWATLKRGYYGTYHRMSPAHLQRYALLKLSSGRREICWFYVRVSMQQRRVSVYGFAGGRWL